MTDLKFETLTPTLIGKLDSDLKLATQVRTQVHQDALDGGIDSLIAKTDPETPGSVSTQHQNFLKNPSAYTVVLDVRRNAVAHMKLDDWTLENQASISRGPQKLALLAEHRLGRAMANHARFITSLVSNKTLGPEIRHDIHIRLLNTALLKASLASIEAPVFIYHHANDTVERATQELDFELIAEDAVANGAPGTFQCLYMRPASIRGGEL